MDSFRQGDIGFFRIDEVPPGYEKTGTVLEILGESGLHLHRVAGVEVFGTTATAERPTETQRAEDGSSIDQEFGLPVAVIRAFEEATVIHDVQGDNERPHDPLKLEPGIYEVRQARSRRDRIVD